MKRTLALCLAAALLVCACLPANAAFGKPFSRIGDVLFYGGHQLTQIDLSALVRDSATLAQGDLYLCRIYDDAAQAIETWNYDRIANFAFTAGGIAVLSDYPGAAAPIEPGDYALFSPQGALFDDTAYYTFSAKEYYRNADASALGLSLCRVGLPAFENYTVTKADGETVYEMQMTLSPELASFYDGYDPNAQIEITCGYGESTGEVFCTLAARPAAYDAESGVLTIELLGADGTPGTNFHNFCVDDEDYGYAFRFTFFPGLFTCGAAKSAHAFRSISGGEIRGIPRRIFTQDDALGRLCTKLSGKLWSEKRYRRTGAMAALALFALPLCVRFMRAVFDSVRAFDGNAADAGIAAFRAYLRRILG